MHNIRAIGKIPELLEEIRVISMVQDDNFGTWVDLRIGNTAEDWNTLKSLNRYQIDKNWKAEQSATLTADFWSWFQVQKNGKDIKMLTALAEELYASLKRHRDASQGDGVFKELRVLFHPDDNWERMFLLPGGFMGGPRNPYLSYALAMAVALKENRNGWNLKSMLAMKDYCDKGSLKWNKLMFKRPSRKGGFTFPHHSDSRELSELIAKYKVTKYDHDGSLCGEFLWNTFEKVDQMDSLIMRIYLRNSTLLEIALKSDKNLKELVGNIRQTCNRIIQQTKKIIAGTPAKGSEKFYGPTGPQELLSFMEGIAAAADAKILNMDSSLDILYTFYGFRQNLNYALSVGEILRPFDVTDSTLKREFLNLGLLIRKALHYSPTNFILEGDGIWNSIRDLRNADWEERDILQNADSEESDEDISDQD